VGIDYVPALLERAAERARAAAELLRVCRPGGTIALASWTPGGFIGDMLRVVSRYAPPPPGVRPPVAALRADLIALAENASRLPAGGPVAIPAAYLEAVVR
jgi:hypothetical protein